MGYTTMPPEVSLLVRYLHQEKGETLKNLLKLYPQYARTTMYRHVKKPLEAIEAGKKPKRSARRQTGTCERL